MKTKTILVLLLLILITVSLTSIAYADVTDYLVDDSTELNGELQTIANKFVDGVKQAQKFVLIVSGVVGGLIMIVGILVATLGIEPQTKQKGKKMAISAGLSIVILNLLPEIIIWLSSLGR